MLRESTLLIRTKFPFVERTAGKMHEGWGEQEQEWSGGEREKGGGGKLNLSFVPPNITFNSYSVCSVGSQQRITRSRFGRH